MSKILCTFSGRFGDILWSLLTVKALAARHGTVDMQIMPAYLSLVPLLNAQPYIDTAFTNDSWICTGSPFGDQPWEAPVPSGYDKVYHLTYRYHPVIPLALHIAQSAGVADADFAQPFIYSPAARRRYMLPNAAVGFNPDWMEQKLVFAKRLREELEQHRSPTFWDLSGMSWVNAAEVIDNASFFLGCRSALAVLATGLGKKRLIYEPHPGRRPSTFGFPHGEEVMPDVNDFPAFLRTAESWIDQDAQEKEKQYGISLHKDGPNRPESLDT